MRRALELLAMMLVGDGVLAAVGPRRHALLWRGRARRSGWNRAMRWFAEHRTWTRGIAAAEIGLGLVLALRQWQRTGDRA